MTFTVAEVSVADANASARRHRLVVRYVKPTDTTMLHVRLRRSELDALKRAAAKLGVDVSEWVRDILRAAAVHPPRDTRR